MRIRGERECRECETRWSYYETGSIECPTCGSLRSVGTDERTEHTASATDLDLTPARALLGPSEADTRAAADRAVELCRAFARGHGFIRAGNLESLDSTYLTALELRFVAAELARGMRTSDDEEGYFLSLLGGADDGDRPAAAAVPESLRAARGLAAANGVRAYREDVRTYLDEHPDGEARAVLTSLADHAKRVEALDGDVAPAHADRLVAVARDVGTYLRADDESALATARDRLARLD